MARVRAETRPSAKRRQAACESDSIVMLGLMAWVIARAMAASSAVVVDAVQTVAEVRKALSKRATVAT